MFRNFNFFVLAVTVDILFSSNPSSIFFSFWWIAVLVLIFKEESLGIFSIHGYAKVNNILTNFFGYFYIFIWPDFIYYSLVCAISNEERSIL